jgi:hypothetical protein
MAVILCLVDKKVRKKSRARSGADSASSAMAFWLGKEGGPVK